jgi:hypothetical protein
VEGQTDKINLMLIRSKLSQAASTTFTQGLESREFENLSTWASWFLNYYSRDDNSKVARRSLEKSTQLGGKHKDVTSFYNHLQNLNRQIEYYDMKLVIFQERFIEGVDPEIASALDVKYRDKLDDLRELDAAVAAVPDKWLLAKAVTLEMAMRAKPPRPWSARSPRPIVGATTVEIPDFALVRPLDDKAREWLTKNNHCFYCRAPGHTTWTCPENPYTERHLPLTKSQVCAPSYLL